LAPVLTDVLAEPVPCDVVGTAQDAQRQAARSTTEWAGIECLDMWLALSPVAVGRAVRAHHAETKIKSTS
jgi:hypothetical protein